ncbi:HD domain-containing protein [Comamonas testosteroni]|uniref:Metal dependent phosphohydrolase n=1 Tax=Comamonas testosteroni (strain DSM 14576 / KF-1) TaxID=399795 RepID=B7WRG1_COMTK|nr:HD domain-containing phosphohydrolase [Comamonas testosteroni]EED67146.1 metal dependent phosphohydrolase [Comamonas testosteroni KF-1]WQG65339.1 HD domain-containing protein [Comamonas testosteroni]
MTEILSDEFESECESESLRFDPAAVDQMEQLIRDFGYMYRERNQLLKEVTRAHHETLLRLAMAAEFKDDDTGAHIIRIGFLAEALALYLGCRPDFASLLRKAAPMHDIGKVGIPDSILKKRGPLTPEERACMNTHTDIGAKLLGQSRIPVFQMASEIAAFHHERFDGKGYPNGISGDEIPLSAQITSIVDIYDALTMDRVYRPAFALNDALKLIQAEHGKALGPRIVDTFLKHIDELENIRLSLIRQAPTFADLIDTP